MQAVLRTVPPHLLSLLLPLHASPLTHSHLSTPPHSHTPTSPLLPTHTLSSLHPLPTHTPPTPAHDLSLSATTCPRRRLVGTSHCSQVTHHTHHKSLSLSHTHTHTHTHPLLPLPSSLSPSCWLWDYLWQSGMAGFFPSLSGGLDSVPVWLPWLAQCVRW